jgi:predicted NACHT family NTPase
MNEIIGRATNSITEILESSKIITNLTKSQLIDTRNLLNQLLQSDSSNNDWARVFYRQLSRLMDYNKSLLADFWIDLHDDILYILEGPDGKQTLGHNWERFVKKMKLECELERRMLHFQKAFGARKSLHQMCCEHREFFNKYLQKCIVFHSKVQVRDLVKNLDDFLCRNYGLPQVLINTENREYLKHKFKSIEIPFHCLNRSFKRYIDEKVNNNRSHFFPSAESRPSHIGYRSEAILSVLESNRWLVILGDPGSAKTTLLRWITRIFAEAVLPNVKKLLLKEDDCSVFRIPILIRIGEFAEWIKQHKTKMLIDYIGEHTWFSESYCSDDNGAVLRELIYHGHALILLDGLDEIPEVGR